MHYEDSDELYTIQKQMLENLTDALNQLGSDDLLAFDRILERKLYDIDRADIHEYTDGSDDGFLYCRGFIVSMGHEYYETAKADPTRAVMDVELEELCYLPHWLYEEKIWLNAAIRAITRKWIESSWMERPTLTDDGVATQPALGDEPPVHLVGSHGPAVMVGCS